MITDRIRQAFRLGDIEGRYDPWVLGAVAALVAIGVVMVASASIGVTARLHVGPFHFLGRHLFYLGVGLVGAAIISRIELRTLERKGPLLLLVALALLVLVLIPGIGMIAWGKNKSESRVTAEFYNCAVEVMRGAEAIDKYVALPQQEAFDIEYWLLEEAKLQRMPKPKSLSGRIAIVTGGASGIGRALAQRLAAEGARVVVADLHLEPAQAVADEVKGMAVRCDVSREADIQALVAATRERYGRVDAYFSNAGILGRPGGIELEDPLWEAMWHIHGMAHVWAARAVVPAMAARGEGFFLVTASAAGLLSIVESAPYAVTKHAAVAFAEWLRIAYGRRGVQVACLCPQAVQTAMISSGGG